MEDLSYLIVVIPLVLLAVALLVAAARHRRDQRLRREAAEREAAAAEARRQFELAEGIRAAAQKRWDDDAPNREALAKRLRAEEAYELTRNRANIAAIAESRHRMQSHDPYLKPTFGSHPVPKSPRVAPPAPTGYEYEARPQPTQSGIGEVGDTLAAAALGYAVGRMTSGEDDQCRAPSKPFIDPDGGLYVAQPFVSGGGGESAGGGAEASWDNGSSIDSSSSDGGSSSSSSGGSDD